MILEKEKLEEELQTNVIDMFIEQIDSDDYPSYRRAVRIENLFNEADESGRKLINDFCLLVCGWSFETLQEKAKEANA